jgi:hypothetical protein
MTRVVGAVEGDERLARGEGREDAVDDAPGAAVDSALARVVS